MNGIQIFYGQSGNGLPLILLHGNSESHNSHAELAKQLSIWYTVYSLDSRAHGQSSKVEKLNYQDMMEDVAAFIGELKLDKPILCGISDGGIVGLLLAIYYPELISKLIACGASTHLAAIKKHWLTIMKLGYLLTRDPKINLMLSPPVITNEQLNSITVQTLLLAGSRDMNYEKDTKEMAAQIPHSTLMILHGETHSSYVKKVEKLTTIIRSFLDSDFIK